MSREQGFYYSSLGEMIAVLPVDLGEADLPTALIANSDPISLTAASHKAILTMDNSRKKMESTERAIKTELERAKVAQKHADEINAKLILGGIQAANAQQEIAFRLREHDVTPTPLALDFAYGYPTTDCYLEDSPAAKNAAHYREEAERLKLSAKEIENQVSILEPEYEAAQEVLVKQENFSRPARLLGTASVMLANVVAVYRADELIPSFNEILSTNSSLTEITAACASFIGAVLSYSYLSQDGNKARLAKRKAKRIIKKQNKIPKNK